MPCLIFFQRVARSQEELRDKVFQPERNRLEVVIRKDVSTSIGSRTAISG